ncbi:hypothetical protein [Klebsiella quasipneumoniae]|uniref:hypothetical protein n=1 Tax=Klebsiella quasipneumoniae TaxID=1463165 RepID=UPI00220957D1|nr:hypothetical protein [Klebsiella quasipneumoniae]BDO01182.1 hypothetical protein KAM622c_07690 [Klebsiella quasipneumoniae subsp. quasipneumoniae]
MDIYITISQYELMSRQNWQQPLLQIRVLTWPLVVSRLLLDNATAWHLTTTAAAMMIIMP